MKNSDPKSSILNDHLFLQGLTCPLKLIFLQANSNLSGSRPVYRQRNKLHLRNALASRFDNCKQTSNHVLDAETETDIWLNEDVVTICGAVIKDGNVLTRIPILVKNGNRYTIIQVHGKLRKESQRKTFTEPGRNKGSSLDLLKAAYRREVLLRRFPASVVHQHFYYPNSDFRSSVDSLHTFVNSAGDHPDDAKVNFKNLFLKIDATSGAEIVRSRIPENLAHEKFTGLSLGEVIDVLVRQGENGGFVARTMDRHEGCNHCEFRRSGLDEPGCWESFFSTDTVQKPGLHTCNLIGQGNDHLARQGIFYQEQVEISDGFHTFGLIQSHGGQNITIQQRRNLQILSARQKEVPTVWIKNNIYNYLDLEYPLHFLDFEAATYAIPMRRGTTPYHPVYFQFSCHTIFSDLKIRHSEWLSTEKMGEQIHAEFVRQLDRIPEIFSGTIIQYSPFEKQSLNRLMSEFRLNSMRFEAELDIVNKIIDGDLPAYQKRYVDISEIIKNSYFNYEMPGSLSLKEVLKSVIRVESENQHQLAPRIDKTIARFKEHLLREFSDTANPYHAIQENNSSIMDGSAAMHAWIAMNNELLSEEEESLIPQILKKYCKLDSLSMVFLYAHLLQFLKKNDGNDIIIF